MQEQNQVEWQAPPPPTPTAVKAAEPPQMSEAATLGGIFFEPGRTFEDLRRKPRFILATIIICVLTSVFMFAFWQKMGEERYRRFIVEQIEKNPQAGSLSSEQKQQSINLQLLITRVVIYALPVFVIVGIALGGLIYWLAGKAMGGSLNYLHGVSVWVYASLPIAVVFTLANFIVLFLKPADEIDIAASQRGLISANPGFLVDGKEMPVLATLLSTFDLFQIWGWVLAAIGLHKVAKISSGAAWAIILILALLGLAWRVVQALLTGTQM
ncbi:MAG: YIP1 family protein [Acidobacteriota bacterium]|nr:YIP1 family protein [Acidobacteriota bacterium]